MKIKMLLEIDSEDLEALDALLTELHMGDEDDDGRTTARLHGRYGVSFRRAADAFGYFKDLVFDLHMKLKKTKSGGSV